MDLQAVTELLHQPLGRYYMSVILVAPPCLRIFRRTGVGAWPVAFLLIPYVGYIFSAGALVALKWPRLNNQGDRA